jgi:hypothetical protein
MQRNRTLLAVCFCAGLLGALGNSLVAWIAGKWGLTAMMGVALAPELTTAWLYPRLIWGGLWGLFYYFTVSHRHNRRHWVRKGLWVSLVPTLVQLFYIYPEQTTHGLMGIGLGFYTPVFVFAFNLVWGFLTGFFTRLLWGRG